MSPGRDPSRNQPSLGRAYHVVARRIDNGPTGALVDGRHFAAKDIADAAFAIAAGIFADVVGVLTVAAAAHGSGEVLNTRPIQNRSDRWRGKIIQLLPGLWPLAILAIIDARDLWVSRQNDRLEKRAVASDIVLEPIKRWQLVVVSHADVKVHRWAALAGPLMRTDQDTRLFLQPVVLLGMHAGRARSNLSRHLSLLRGTDLQLPLTGRRELTERVR